ncbi:MAG: ferredoxin [Eubacteriales bacterium]|nr:ferredoxin [Eubacteriales bacterium]
MTVELDRSGCIACGLCEATCPAVFRIADDGLAEVYQQPADAVQQADAQQAADSCPVAVIHTAD